MYLVCTEKQQQAKEQEASKKSIKKTQIIKNNASKL